MIEGSADRNNRESGSKQENAEGVEARRLEIVLELKSLGVEAMALLNKDTDTVFDRLKEIAQRELAIIEELNKAEAIIVAQRSEGQ